MKNLYLKVMRKTVATLTVMAIPFLAIAQLDSAYCVSDSTWLKSDSITASTVFGYWSGVAGVLPDTGSYNSNAMIGQPYGYHTIDSVEGSYVVKTDNNITYFRKKLILDTLSDLSIRVRLNIDDHAEIYINGTLLVGIYDTVENTNWHDAPFDVLIEEDGTVHNGYMGGDLYDAITTLDMDSLFNIGENDIVVVCRNLSGSTNKGGFSLRIDLKGTPGVKVTGSVVSTDGFTKSTVTSPSSYSGNWSGVSGALPLAATYTLPAVKGQPYSFHSIDSVPDADVIVASNHTTYYRYEFDITKKDSLNARFRMNVDDAMEIYINGFFVALEGNTSTLNRRNPNHDIQFNQDGSVSNGFMGGDAFNSHTFSSMSDIFVVGTNELVLVIRNQPKPGDLGGFSFRMDLDSDGEDVIVDNKSARANVFNRSDNNSLTADIYPNPSLGWINVTIDDPELFNVYLYDVNGRLLTSVANNSGTAGLNISDYAKGVYFVKVVTPTKSFSGKVLKQ